MSTPSKRELVEKIIAHLTAEVELYAAAARAAHAEATHEQSRADNKYDTRGLEASYLARGQSRQLAETEQAIEQYRKLPLRDLGPEDPIDLGALVRLTARSRKACYFIGPCAGGTEIPLTGGEECLVITPQSPLGRQLMERRQGEKLQIEIAGGKAEYKVASVS